jgi:hypothetical protein
MAKRRKPQKRTVVVAERDDGERVVATRGHNRDNEPFVVMHYRGVGSKKKRRAVKS